MEHVLVLLRLLLAGVLAVAGSAKLADLPGARRAFVDLGGPASLARIAAILLPLVEVATALALLTSGLALVGAWAALILFSIFTGVLGVALARSRVVDCHCFGQLSQSPVSWRVLARTGLFAMLAAVVVGGGRDALGPSAATWFAMIVPDDVLVSVMLVAAVCAGTWAVAWRREARRLGDAPLRDTSTAAGDTATVEAPGEGWIVGAPVPGLGAQVIRGRPALLLFVSAACPPCRTLLPDVATWRRQFDEAADLVVVTREDPDAQDGLGGAALADAFRVRWTPAAVLVGAAGRIASPLRYGTDGVRCLVEALGESIADGAVDESLWHRRLGTVLGASGVVVGDVAAAPEIVEAAWPHGETGDTLLLFWDPGCTYCQGMVSAIRQIEAAPPAGAPRVVFVVPREASVASGPQAMFTSPSVYDPESRVAPLFGAQGTPSAVLVTRDGRVASTVAIGKDSVLSLLEPVVSAAGR